MRWGAALGFLRLLALAFVAGGAVMVLELAAPRLTAPALGTTALTWTVVIATFLAGLAVGNVCGGRVADRNRPGTMGILFLLAALTTLLTIPLHDVATAITRGQTHGLRVLVAVPLTFLPVALSLGTLPPAFAREILRSGRAPGRRLGTVAAAGAAGSVAGTFLAGFVLVPALGTRDIFVATAVVLGFAAIASPWKRRRAPPSPVWRWTYESVLPRGWTALAILAGAALLALEIAAGRIASYRLGNSIYTWTSVIGVVLLGLTIGAALGGLLADWCRPRHLLRWLLLAASAATTLLLWGPAILDHTEHLSRIRAWDWAWAVLTTTAAAFLLPSIILGMLSPIIIRAALADPKADGRVVGGLYAAGTLGAVGGTVIAGYVLVPWLGLERLVLLLAVVLAAASGFVRGRQPYVWLGFLLLLALTVQAPWEPLRRLATTLELREETPALTVTDSRYSRIRVRPVQERWVRLTAEPDLDDLYEQPLLSSHGSWDENRNRLGWNVKKGPMSIIQLARLRLLMRTDADRRAVERLRDLTKHEQRKLVLDHLNHGYVDLQDPTWLGYEYERLYDAVVRYLWPEQDMVRCLFLGGGSFTFQRYLLARRGAGVSCVTVEIDPEVTRTARGWLGLVPDPRHEIAHEDARTFVQDLPPSEAGFHFVFGDAFDDFAIPFHLTTREFAESLEARMTPDGVYLVNVIDTYASGRFLGAFLRTLKSVFAHVRLLSVTPRDDRRRNTFVVVASNAPLSLADLKLDEEAGAAAILYDSVEMKALCGRPGPPILTDDHAPVEILIAPISRDR